MKYEIFIRELLPCNQLVNIYTPNTPDVISVK